MLCMVTYDKKIALTISLQRVRKLTSIVPLGDIDLRGYRARFWRKQSAAVEKAAGLDADHANQYNTRWMTSEAAVVRIDPLIDR